MPGAVWRVSGPDGTLSHGSIGDAARLPVPEPAHPDTPYDLASLTKPLATALVAVLLEHDGVLDLDGPASRFLPELEGTHYAGVTLLDLGVHRSGLPAWSPIHCRGGSRDAYLHAIAALAPAGPPGRTLYSDLGYLLLGFALERAAGGASLSDLFDARVAAPLALRATGFAAGGARFEEAAPTEWGNACERRMAGDGAEGCRWRTGMIRGQPHDGNAHGLGGIAGHAGLFGTAAEVEALAREVLEPVRLPLAVRPRSRLLTPLPGEGGRTFGFVTAAASQAGRDVLPAEAPGHTGFTGTSLWLDPVAGRTYVLLTNRVHPSVPQRDFQAVRAGFHRKAAAL